MRWFIGVIVLLLGCDPPGASEPAKPQVDAQPEPSATDERARFGTCMAACAEAKMLSETDRETCRLSCEAAKGDEEVTPTAIGKALTGRLVGCVERCPRGEIATDRGTCMLTCAQQASSGSEASHWSAEQRGCAAACLEQVGTCLGRCPQGGDDGATCRLQCTSAGERCVPRCDVPGLHDVGPAKAVAPAPKVTPEVPPPPGPPVPPS